MILHVLNASPSSVAFSDCVRVIQSGDALVLIGDGVYAAMEGTGACDELLCTGIPIHLLRSDAIAAGVAFPTDSIQVIDMDGFIVLTERFPRQICWY